MMMKDESSSSSSPLSWIVSTQNQNMHMLLLSCVFRGAFLLLLSAAEWSRTCLDYLDMRRAPWWKQKKKSSPWSWPFCCSLSTFAAAADNDEFTTTMDHTSTSSSSTTPTEDKIVVVTTFRLSSSSCWLLIVLAVIRRRKHKWWWWSFGNNNSESSYGCTFSVSLSLFLFVCLMFSHFSMLFIVTPK